MSKILRMSYCSSMNISFKSLTISPQFQCLIMLSYIVKLPFSEHDNFRLFITHMQKRVIVFKLAEFFVKQMSF